MLVSKLKAPFLIATLALCAAGAHATVIDFEGITTPDFSKGFAAGSTLPTNAGYAVTVTGSSPYDAAYVYGGPPAGDTGIAFNGTAYLTIVGSTGITVTSATLFSVASIDLDNSQYIAGRNVIAILTGTYADGRANSIVSYTFNNDNSLTTNDFITKMLTGFTDLTSFSVTTSGFGYSLAVDNINVVAASAASPVTEPTSWAMLGLGLGLIGVTSRRKKSV